MPRTGATRNRKLVLALQKEGEMAGGYVRIRCTDCSKIVLVLKGDIPSGSCLGEWFEAYCPGCGNSNYMELVEDRHENKTVSR